MADTTIAAASARLSKGRQPAIEVEKRKQPRPVKALHPVRIDVIPLFGAHMLIRASDGLTWVFTTPSTKPERLTKRQSMFINAALTAAGGK